MRDKILLTLFTIPFIDVVVTLSVPGTTMDRLAALAAAAVAGAEASATATMALVGIRVLGAAPAVVITILGTWTTRVKHQLKSQSQKTLPGPLLVRVVFAFDASGPSPMPSFKLTKHYRVPQIASSPLLEHQNKFKLHSTCYNKGKSFFLVFFLT